MDYVRRRAESGSSPLSTATSSAKQPNAVAPQSLTTSTATISSLSVTSTTPQSSVSTETMASCTTATWENGEVHSTCPGDLTTQSISSTSTIASTASSTSLVADSLHVQPTNGNGFPSASSSPRTSHTSNTEASTTNSAAAISSKGRISGGAAAGVAIAMLLVGALLAGAVFFFLLRRQKKRQPPTSTAYQTLHPPYDAATALPEKGPTTTGAFATSIDDMLPQPVADDTITDAALKIRDNIKNHVRTYYCSALVPVASINQLGLQELATATGVSSSILAGALSNPSTRQDALRLFIGWIMLSRCTEERDPSLLPAELSRLAISIPERDPGM
jgi:hypothetical protein